MQTTVQYRNDFKDERTLHPLWEHSNPNWTRQISIEMITKMKETSILSGDISNQNWDNSLVLKWLKRWQNPTLFLGIFTFQLKKTVQYWNYFKDDRPEHPLWGHSNPNWKRQLSIEMITNMTKPYFICCDIQVQINRTLPYNFCWDIQTPTTKDSSISKWF